MSLRTMAAAAILAAVSQCAVGGDAELRNVVTAARERHGIPAIGVRERVDGHDAAITAGVRAQGDPAAATDADLWHIGSDTKAFTATLIGLMVDAGELRFDETLAEALPQDAAAMDPAYRRVTLLQLLSHTAGLPTLTSDKELPAYIAIASRMRSVREQRAAIARAALAAPPATPVGEFHYSNLGFIVAGAIAEAHSGKPWEELVRSRIFVPLGITHAGFGAPGSPERVDEPRGHERQGKSLVALPPGRNADNPPWLGPAGTIHITLEDWMRFASDQMDGALGHGKLLRAETYRRLFTPVTGNYALGWGAKIDDDGVASVITHTGSNGFWLAEVRILPKRHAILLVAMNCGGDEAAAAMQEITKAWREGLAR